MDQKNNSERIRIGRREYEIQERLSLPNRGRWKIRDPEPYPKGTTRTAIILPDSAGADQLRKSVTRIPSNQSNLPKLVSWDRRNGQLSMVVTWYEGTDVARYLNRVKNEKASRPSAWEAIRRIKSLAFSLDVLHQTCRVVHGDIKPANLIFPSDPGSLSLIDFGSSWQMEKTAYRELGDGTNPFYSAPEVFLDLSKVDARADQFSAAVVLYEMLTLKLPYGELGGKAGHPKFSSAASEYTRPSSQLSDGAQLPRSIVKQIDDVLGTALQLDPNRRFPTTKKFADALDTIWMQLKLAKSNTTNHQESFWQTLLRWTSSAS